MMKSLLVRPYAKYLARRTAKMRDNAVADQQRIFQQLIAKGKNTAFGEDHDFANIRSHADYAQRVPIRDYEAGREYYDRIKNGETDVCWPGKPKYFAKTSGTTSGTKYIPLTHDSMPNHLNGAREAMMCYAAQGRNSKIFDGKVMFLSGSPVMTDTNGIPTGRLSGIVNHEIPAWLKGNQLPSFETNCIEEWEDKVDKVVEETRNADLRLIGGIPPWVQMYFERLLEATGKRTVKEVFPNLQLFIYGGVNYEPYRAALEGLIGERIDSIELFPASEGFMAYQDTLDHKGLLLNSDSGIFYEFVPLSEIHNDNPTRLTISEVKVGVDYAIILTNNAGLWAYNIGDTVRFVSLDPYRLVVSGRVKHYISAFGEHVIAKEVEQALSEAVADTGAMVREMTVAPQVTPADGEQPYHEWFIEFEKEPRDLTQLAKVLDKSLREQNIYYNDLITGNILQPLKVTVLPANAFRDLMKKRGKLGGQNKVPRLSNDRKIASELEDLIKS